MKPDREACSREFNAALIAGDQSAALAVKLEYLRQLANHFLDDAGIEVVDRCSAQNPAPTLSELYDDYVRVLTAEVAAQGEKSSTSLHIALEIYNALRQLFGLLARGGPIDADGVAQLILAGSYIGVVGGLDGLQHEAEMNLLAEAQTQHRADGSAARSEKKKQAQLVAFVAEEVALRHGTGPSAAQKFRDKFSPGFSDGALAKAGRRHPTLRPTALAAVQAAVEGKSGSVPENLQLAVNKALRAFTDFAAAEGTQSAAARTWKLPDPSD